MKVSKKLVLSILLSLALFAVIGYAVFRYVAHWEYVKATPYDVLISDIQSDSVTISWKTDVDTPTYIKIGENEQLWGNGEVTNSHRVKLAGLKELSKYNFSISDGKREWEEPSDTSTDEIATFVSKELTFQTYETPSEVSLPLAGELKILPNELIYVTLYNQSTNQYSEVRSEYANRFGGVVIDIAEFNVTWDPAEVEIKDIQYFTNQKVQAKRPFAIYAAEINCNQDAPNQSFDGLSKDEYADLATRWVAGRGKNYAKECYNDTILRARQEGVDPGFALTIWLNESGASNYTHNPNLVGKIEDFGIHGQATVPAQNFDKQISYFLTLEHKASCPGLSAWEAWGNMYRWGSCNEDDPVKRQQGIDYYKGIETVYGLVTNGRSLPSSVTGLPKSGGDDDGGWDDTSGSLCCALKIDNQEKFQGDYENNVEGKTCEQLWEVGRSVYGGKLEYSVEIKDKVGDACQVKYDGVCCQLENDIKWWPKTVCTNVIPNISTSQACKEYTVEKACFFREGKYQWLPKSIGDDFEEGVTTESQCEARNDLSIYTISLQKGINFVGFDFEPTHNTAAMYASKLLEQNPNILLIGNFEGFEWKDIVKQSEELPFAGNDFSFKQNKGYLLIVAEDMELQIDGWRDKDAKYGELIDGWNLVGGNLYTKSSKASTLISNLKKESISVSTVGVWSKELSRFNYRREAETGEIYGEDVKLIKNEGIFLRK